jgi:beta-glucanase (GH16 family)
MRSLSILCIFIICISCGLYKKKSNNDDTQKPIVTASEAAYTLVWSDEFSENGMPNSSNWNYDVGGHGWGNNESQYYTEADSHNVLVQNGSLHIKAQKENYKTKEGTWKYTSTRLVTRGKYDWRGGYFEIRAKLPYGRGSWPAIWMMPDNSPYGAWPSCGEIDIMEHVGYNAGAVVGSVHTESYNHKIGTQKNASVAVATPYDFHTYGLRWDRNEIRWYVDNVEYFSFKNEGTGYKEWPFDQTFHIILNIAVGGSWGGQQGIDDFAFPMTMEIDYVRVYQ